MQLKKQTNVDFLNYMKKFTLKGQLNQEKCLTIRERPYWPIE